MFDYEDNGIFPEDKESYPDYYYTFNQCLERGENPGYYEIEELNEIIDIYFSQGLNREGKYAIAHALKLYPDNEDLLYEVLLVLSDYDLWNDLLDMTEKYHSMNEVWIDGHKLTALLHLGMEEDAFQFFKTMKSKYAEDKKKISIIYQAMGEALYEVDLYDAAIDVIQEIITILGEDVDFLWLQLQSYLALEDKESVLELAEQIQKLCPMDDETWSRLGNTYKEVGEHEKAIEAYEFALSLGNNNANYILSLIYAYEKNGNYTKALEKAEEYLKQCPDSYLVNLLAINICSHIENWEKALEFTENAIQLEPKVDSLYIYKCNYLLKLGEEKKAIKALEDGLNNTEDASGDIKKQLLILKREFPQY